MSDQPHVLARQLLGKETLEDCSLQEVRSLVHHYPYFAPAQFLLLHKLKQEGDPGYGAQLQKAILYYPDPLSFQYLVDPARFHTVLPEVKTNEPLITTPPPAAEIQPVNEVVTGAEPLKAEVPAETETVEEQEETVSGIKAVEKEEAPTADQGSEPAPKPVLQSQTLAQPLSDLTFEPYHTVDYFASQGIKLSQEEIPKDKFGKQLKSFTEWLKDMKRLPATEMGRSVDPKTESKVQNLANHSVHDSNVWTEAMAEVWIKQGNNARAIEVYNKLSLLNPSKKAYFAGKIENLKRS